MLRHCTLLRAAPLKPMLASPITVTASSSKERRNLPHGPYFVSPKLDGVRCIITSNGIFTRRLQRLHGLDKIAAAVKPLHQKDRSLVLDGELYTSHGAGAFEGLVSAVAKLRNAPRKAGGRVTLPKDVTNKLAFHCFDVVKMNANQKQPQICEMRGGARGATSNGPPRVVPLKTPFHGRLRALAHLKRQLQSGPASPIRFVPHLPATDVRKARQHTRLFLQAGYEGAVLRCFDNQYAPGQRSKSMIKIVPWIDSEFRVLRFIRGPGAASSKTTAKSAKTTKKGKKKAAAKKTKKAAPPQQQAKVINSVELITEDGVIFRAHVGVPAGVAKEWLAMDKGGKLTGVYATVRYPRQTARGVPRFGVVKGIRGKSKRWFL